jgi:hypothetical protein
MFVPGMTFAVSTAKEPTMTKLLAIAVLAALGLAACAHPRDSVPITVTHEGRASGSTDVAAARARDGGRAAGAGGSHAPGSTGLGAGTMGTETTAPIGSAR